MSYYEEDGLFYDDDGNEVSEEIYYNEIVCYGEDGTEDWHVGTEPGFGGK